MLLYSGFVAAGGLCVEAAPLAGSCVLTLAVEREAAAELYSLLEEGAIEDETADVVAADLLDTAVFEPEDA